MQCLHNVGIDILKFFRQKDCVCVSVHVKRMWGLLYTLATLYFAKFLCPRKGKPAEAPYLKKDGSNLDLPTQFWAQKGPVRPGSQAMGDANCCFQCLLSRTGFSPYGNFPSGKVMINIDKPSIFGGSLFSKKPNEFNPAKGWFGMGGPRDHPWCRAPRMASPTPCPDLCCVECAVSIMFLCNDVD